WPGAAPLDEAGFARELAGRTAILRAEGPRGRAVLFAPNPEIGGDPGLEAPSWRLILNAVHSLMLRSRPPLGAPAPLSLAAPDSGRAGLAETLAAALGGGGGGSMSPRAGGPPRRQTRGGRTASPAAPPGSRASGGGPPSPGGTFP